MPRKPRVPDATFIESALVDVERALVTAHAELQTAEERKKEATDEHKEAQLRVNGLVTELVRRINGEQSLPL